jgi:hypothetical protein
MHHLHLRALLGLVRGLRLRRLHLPNLQSRHLFVRALLRRMQQLRLR